MDEEVISLARVLNRSAYGVCARCGAVFRRRGQPAARVRHSPDEASFCRRCRRESLQGEPDVETVVEE